MVVDYEAALQKLRQRYLIRLGNSLRAIDNFLTQRQLNPLRKDDVGRAHSLAHGLAGSGTIFGFPDITAAGQTADRLLNAIAVNLAEDEIVSDQLYAEINRALLTLRAACEAALARETALADHKELLPSRIKDQAAHIHIIDDDAELCALLALELSREQFAVSVSADGEAALHAIRRKAPDLIILDISLPQMSGHDVLHRLKQDPEFITIPILVLTGRDERLDLVKALHAGALDYLVKPFDMQRLRARVTKILLAA